jgi:hypothetical protein
MEHLVTCEGLTDAILWHTCGAADDGIVNGARAAEPSMSPIV